jgi:hypothetical protein
MQIYASNTAAPLYIRISNFRVLGYHYSSRRPHRSFPRHHRLFRLLRIHRQPHRHSQHLRDIRPAIPRQSSPQQQLHPRPLFRRILQQPGRQRRHRSIHTQDLRRPAINWPHAVEYPADRKSGRDKHVYYDVFAVCEGRGESLVFVVWDWELCGCEYDCDRDEQFACCRCEYCGAVDGESAVWGYGCGGEGGGVDFGDGLMTFWGGVAGREGNGRLKGGLKMNEELLRRQRHRCYTLDSDKP